MQTEGSSRLAITGWLFLFCFLIVMISGGIATVLGYTPRSQTFGWVFVAIGVSVAMISIKRWAQALPGIFGLATLNSLIILITGHALNQPGVPVPRGDGVLLTAVMVVATVATWEFAGPSLTVSDRAACVGILSCFVAVVVCSMASVAHWEIPVSIGILACLSVPLAHKLWRFKKRHLGI
jgi:hypothetical protein